MLSDSFSVFMETDEGLKRLEGFSEFNFKAGVKCYIRKYFSAKEKTVDVTGSKPVISYKFDRMKNNAVHDFLSSLTDCTEDISKTTKVVLVDFSNETDDGYEALMQEFLVVCSDLRPENGFLDYSGQLIAMGEKVKGTALSDDGFKTVKFMPKRRGILCD